MIILGVTSSSDKNIPDAPIIGTAVDVGTGRAYNNGAATVPFTPQYGGGLDVTYTATSSPGGFTASGSSSPLTVTGLQSGVAYTFTVTATNSLGSATSAASNSITATTVPQAPTIGTATDGGTGTTVSVAFTAGATGGKAVSTYTATSSPGSITGTAASSPITVSGLTTGQAYTFTVTATNANGTSTASAASNSVTPALPASFDSIATLTSTSATSFTFSSIPTTYTHLQLRIFFASSAGSMTLRMNGETGTVYSWSCIETNGSGILGAQSASSNQLFVAGGGNYNVGTSSGAGTIINIYNANNTNTQKMVTAQTGYYENTSFRAVILSTGAWNKTTAITSLTLLTPTSLSGTYVALYGVL